MTYSYSSVIMLAIYIRSLLTGVGNPQPSRMWLCRASDMAPCASRKVPSPPTRAEGWVGVTCKLSSWSGAPPELLEIEQKIQNRSRHSATQCLSVSAHTQLIRCSCESAPSSLVSPSYQKLSAGGRPFWFMWYNGTLWQESPDYVYGMGSH